MGMMGVGIVAADTVTVTANFYIYLYACDLRT